MSAARGINSRVLINGYDLSNGFKRTSTNNTVDALDATAFQDTAKAYVMGFTDGRITLEGFYDAVPGTTADGIDDLLRPKLASATKSILSIAPENDTTLGDYTFIAQADLLSLVVEEPANGLIMQNAEFQASGKIGAGRILKSLAAVTSTGNGSALDNGAATSNGGRGQIQATAKSGTSPSIASKIQHSTDSSTWVDLVTFTAVTDIAAEQIEVTGTVNRYLREIHTLSGSSSPSVTYQASFARY